MDGVVDVSLLEYSVREHLNKTAQRVMGVINPLKVVITNYPETWTEELNAINNPEDDSMGTRKVPFSRELYIEQDDFLEDPPRKFFRLAPGREVRLRYGYFVKCVDVIKDPDSGEIVELRCTYDPATRGGDAPDGRKVRGTLHWVSASHALEAEVRLYDVLFTREDPDDVGAALHLLVETLDRVRAVQFGAVLAGEGHVGQDVVLALVHQIGQLGPARAELIGHAAPGLAGATAMTSCKARLALNDCTTWAPKRPPRLMPRRLPPLRPHRRRPRRACAGSATRSSAGAL